MQRTKRLTIKQLFSDSIKELTLTQNIVICGMMAALAIVLNYTTSIYITDNIRIGFSGIPNRIVDFLMGPAVGGLFGAALDILKFFTKPGPYSFFPGYTLTAIMGGLIYGSILYKRPVSLKRILFAEFLAKVFLNCGLNTLWGYMMTNKGFWAILSGKIIKNVIMWPIDSILLLFFLQLVSKILNQTEFSQLRKIK